MRERTLDLYRRIEARSGAIGADKGNRERVYRLPCREKKRFVKGEGAVSISDDTMQLAYRGVEGDERIWGVYWKHIAEPPSWSGTSVLGNGAFNSTHGPALCATPQGEVQMVWKGSGTDQRIFTASERSWKGPVPPVSGPGVYQTIDRPAIAYDQNGRCLLVWRDPSNALLWSRRDQSLAWSAPRSTGATASHGPALFVQGNTVFLFWAAGASQTTQNGQICWAQLGGDTWSSAQPVHVTAGAALTTDTPAIVAYEKVILAWKGRDDQNIWFSEFENGSWTAPDTMRASLGAILTSNGPALAATNAGLYMAWKGVAGDQRVWIATRGSNGVWSPPAVLDPGINSSASPALLAHEVFTY
jgi:hypothetical protein